MVSVPEADGRHLSDQAGTESLTFNLNLALAKYFLKLDSTWYEKKE